MDRRELSSLVRAVTVAVRESMVAQVRELKEYVDQRCTEIAQAQAQVKSEPAPAVDYELLTVTIQSEVDRRIDVALSSALAALPPPVNGKDAEVDYGLIEASVHSYVDRQVGAAVAALPLPKDGAPGRDADPQVISEMVTLAVAALPPARDGRDADPELIRAMVQSEVKDAVAALPAPKEGPAGPQGEPGRDASPVDIDAVVMKVIAAIPAPKDGEPGRDAPPVDTSAIVAEVLSRIPTPKDGKDGESVRLELVREIIFAEVRQAVEAMPTPKDGINGKDAPAVDVEALIAEAVKRIPPPKDGRDVDQEAVKVFVVEQVRQAVAALPPPKDGKDAEPIHPDTIRLMIVEEAKKAVAELPKPRDGRDGNDGRSALSLEILPTIDPTKSYPRGTEATYRGGTIKALRTTDPVGDGTLEQAGWAIIADGVADWKISQAEDEPRIFVAEMVRTSGKSEVMKAYLPVPLHQGVWSPSGDYKKADTVQRDGSQWLCLKDGTKTQPGMTGCDWRLVVKKGADGKSIQGPKGDPGKPGRDGRDLTQISADGSKH